MVCPLPVPELYMNNCKEDRQTMGSGCGFLNGLRPATLCRQFQLAKSRGRCAEKTERFKASIILLLEPSHAFLLLFLEPA
jgi:hypothetical protein